MVIQDAVKNETRKIALGTFAFTAVMLLIFLLIRRIDLSVILGALLGDAAAIGNFFWMALSVQKAAEKMNDVSALPDDETDNEETEETVNQISPQAKDAKRSMQLSYTLRMLMLIVVLLVAVKLPMFSPLAAIIPLFFPRIVIFILGFIMRKEDKAS